MATWQKLSFKMTPGLKSELDTVNSWSENRSIESMYPEIKRAVDYYQPEIGTPGFKELQEFLERNPGKLRILEVGAGIGRTSVYLASQGHTVAVLEPVSEQCRILHSFAERWTLPLAIYEGIAEEAGEILKYEQEKFDLCLFNGSLHHCDDPLQALRSCKQLLKENGKLLLLNEPILKFFRSKKWYYRQLEVNPQAMGHYGGNEHIYYAYEYPRMIRKAGFKQTTMVPSKGVTDFRASVAHMATVNQCGHYIYSEQKLFLHTAWTFLLWRISKFPKLSSVFCRLSLGPATIEATVL